MNNFHFIFKRNIIVNCILLRTKLQHLNSIKNKKIPDVEKYGILMDFCDSNKKEFTLNVDNAV